MRCGVPISPTSACGRAFSIWWPCSTGIRATSWRGNCRTPSIPVDTGFCLAALEGALRQGQPVIFNTDQGVQFTSTAYTSRLEQADIQISWDGRGRALDNIFVERLWRSVK
jgi:transposase InsO family protein